MAKSLEKKEAVRIKCLNCKEVKSSSMVNFYSNNHPLFSTDKLEVCKDCILEYIGDKNSNGFIARILTVLSLLDRPFIMSKWEKCGGEWGKYITQISSLPQNKNLRHSDGDSNKKNNTKESNFNILDANRLSDSDYTDEELVQLSRFWGKGIDIEDLEFLQSEYQKFINSYECDSYAMELLFQEASQQRLSIKKLRLENKSVDKELKTLQDILGSANIKPAQESGANAVEQSTFGTLIKKYENERPVPDPDDAWKDVDGIGKYISVWFFGHFSKMLGIKNEHSDLYDKELKNYTVDTPLYEDEEPESDPS